MVVVDWISASNRDAYREAEIIAEVREKILASYVDTVPSEKLVKGALQGMMSVLDDYSEYLDEDMLRQLYENTEGEFIGVGIVVTLENGVLSVIAPLEDSPAAKAGILPGDQILKIDHISTEIMGLNEAVLKLRGNPGSSITLTVLHENSKIPKDISMLRDVIQIHSVKAATLIDPQAGIGYLRLTKFNKQTGKELAQAIENLVQQGMKSLILDLRFNPGGLVDAAVAVVDLFVQDGVIVYTKGRSPDSYQVFRATPQSGYESLPLVVLVNKRSASASEIVSGSLQDHHRATVIGERTYGKALVQTVLGLRDEKTAIKMTTARYYTPAGRSLQKTKEQEGGVVPDIAVIISVDEEQTLMQEFYQNASKVPKSTDLQLQKAVEFLKLPK